MMKNLNNGYKGAALGWALDWALLGVGPCDAKTCQAATPSTQAEVSTDTLFEQALQAQKDGQHDQAITLLTPLLARDSKNTEAYVVRAGIYNNQKKSAQAIADYQQALKLDPKNASAQGGLGWALILEGRFEEAREPTEKAQVLAPDVFSWLINLGDLELLAGNQKPARLSLSAWIGKNQIYRSF